MTHIDTRRDRRPYPGQIDFTMMYVAHDAFSRDLRRLATAAQRGRAKDPVERARWARFTTQLHIHHTAEDESIWPQLRVQVFRPTEVAVLDAMEREHAQLDPQLARVDAAFASGDEAVLADQLQALSVCLAAHMAHEEDEALTLIETYLGASGWAAFGRGMRRTQGIRGVAEYLPWVLDGASDDTRDALLSLLPPPARVIYRRVWAPRYQRQTADVG